LRNAEKCELVEMHEDRNLWPASSLTKSVQASC
jgi:hypothetical protein